MLKLLMGKVTGNITLILAVVSMLTAAGLAVAMYYNGKLIEDRSRLEITVAKLEVKIEALKESIHREREAASRLKKNNEKIDDQFENIETILDKADDELGTKEEIDESVKDALCAIGLVEEELCNEKVNK